MKTPCILCGLPFKPSEKEAQYCCQGCRTVSNFLGRAGVRVQPAHKAVRMWLWLGIVCACGLSIVLLAYFMDAFK